MNNFSADFMHNEAILKELKTFASKVKACFESKTEKEIANSDVSSELDTLEEEARTRIREIDSSFDCGCYVGSFMTHVVEDYAEDACGKTFD